MRFSLPDARAARPDQFFGAADMRLLTKQQFARVHSIDARSNVIFTLNNRD